MFMMFQFRFVFAVFGLTAMLIFTVFLRNANNRVFYELLAYRAELNQLKQELSAKELQLEAMINPAAVSERLGTMNTEQ